MKYLAAALIVTTVIVSGCTDELPDEQLPENNNSTISPSNQSENTTLITHTSSGFQPQTITIEKGETVTWQSETGNMWVASDRHPTHTQYAGTSRTEHCSGGDQTSAAFDQCSTGTEFSFTFEKSGDWNYHNHENSFQGGTVIVE